MGRQLNFFLTDSDNRRLEEAVLNENGILVLLSRSRGPFPQAVESINITENDQPQTIFYLAREMDLNSIVLKEVPEQAHWRIDDLRSPVVQFIKSLSSQNELRRGRFYFTESYFDELGNLVSKEPDFIKWAESIMSKAKRVLNYDKTLTAYLGSEAQEMRSAGLRLIDF